MYLTPLRPHFYLNETVLTCTHNQKVMQNLTCFFFLSFFLLLLLLTEVIILFFKNIHVNKIGPDIMLLGNHRMVAKVSLPRKPLFKNQINTKLSHFFGGVLNGYLFYTCLCTVTLARTFSATGIFKDTQACQLSVAWQRQNLCDFGFMHFPHLWLLGNELCCLRIAFYSKYFTKCHLQK